VLTNCQKLANIHWQFLQCQFSSAHTSSTGDGGCGGGGRRRRRGGCGRRQWSLLRTAISTPIRSSN